MTRFEKIKEATLEELADIIFDLDDIFVDSDEEHEICSKCEYHDAYDGCTNYDYWTDGVCDPHGICGYKERIKRWLMEES